MVSELAFCAASSAATLLTNGSDALEKYGSRSRVLCEGVWDMIWTMAFETQHGKEHGKEHGIASVF
jgi:hypothetical protein